MGLSNQELEPIIQKAKSTSVAHLFSGNKSINRQIPAAIKARLENAKGTKCPLCPNVLVFTSNKSPGSLHPCEASPDHILDLVLGGNNAESNFIVICHRCNRAKNHAMLNHLKTTSPGKTPGPNTGWREVFRSKPENIVKLFDYIDWSYMLPHSQRGHVDSTLQGYFDESRFRDETPPERLETPAELSDLERRVQRLENTLWKRTMRAIGSFFQRAKSPINAVEKTSIEKQAPQPQKEDPHNLDFTPEEFSRGLLSHKKRAYPVTFTTLYARLIKEDSRYNLKALGIKPNSYLIEHCSHLLEIEESRETENHYWINNKPTATTEDLTNVLLDNIEDGMMMGTIADNLPKWCNDAWNTDLASPTEIKVHLGMGKNKVLQRVLQDLLGSRVSFEGNPGLANQVVCRISKASPGTPRIEPPPIKSFKEIIIIILEQEKGPITFNSLGGKLSKFLDDEYDFTTQEVLILEGLNENLSIRKLIINQLGDDVIISDDNKEVELNRRD